MAGDTRHEQGAFDDRVAAGAQDDCISSRSDVDSPARPSWRMSSEALPAGDEPRALSFVLDELIGKDLAARLDLSRRAQAAWIMANGDTERRHTRRAWLRASGRERVAPVLVVEVDSHAVITDFTAKRDVYLGRLAFYGLQVSRIEFRYVAGRADRVAHAESSDRVLALTRQAPAHDAEGDEGAFGRAGRQMGSEETHLADVSGTMAGHHATGHATTGDSSMPRALTDVQRRRVDELAAQVPESLRESVTRAIAASLIRAD